MAALCVVGTHAGNPFWGGNDCPHEWETRRGGACYGNPLSHKSPTKRFSSSYALLDNGIWFSGPVTGHKSVYGTLSTADYTQLSFDAIATLVQLAEFAGLSEQDIFRNPVRANDITINSVDPNSALVIRNGLRDATQIVRGLNNPITGVADWPIFPSDQEKTAWGRSYVVMPNEELLVMVATGFIGNSPGRVHDYATKTQVIQFNNLRYNVTAFAEEIVNSPSENPQGLSVAALAEKLTIHLTNNNFRYRLANGTFVYFHYPPPTSLAYTPNATVCDVAVPKTVWNAWGLFGPKYTCRVIALRSCERAFSLIELATRNCTNGLCTSGFLLWKGQRYACTDVINYNNGGGLWCRIANDSDITVAFEIAEAHHRNGRDNLGVANRGVFKADGSDDVLVDLFLTNPVVQYPLFLATMNRIYNATGVYPAVVINYGRLVGRDKIEFTGEHSTGPKRLASSNKSRRVTFASLQGFNAVTVGTEAWGSGHTAHKCSATACTISSSPEQQIRDALDNALADFAAIDFTKDEVNRAEFFINELYYPRPNATAPIVNMKPLVEKVIRETWDVNSLPASFIEPHIDFVSNIVASSHGRTIQPGALVQVSLRANKRM